MDALRSYDAKHGAYVHKPKLPTSEKKPPVELKEGRRYKVVRSHWNKKSSKSDLQKLADILRGHGEKSKKYGKYFKKKGKKSALKDQKESEDEEDVDRQPKSNVKPKKLTTPKIDAPSPRKVNRPIYDDPLASDSDSMFSDDDMGGLAPRAPAPAAPPAAAAPVPAGHAAAPSRDDEKIEAHAAIADAAAAEKGKKKAAEVIDVDKEPEPVMEVGDVKKKTSLK